jgi:hypothetical protein
VGCGYNHCPNDRFQHFWSCLFGHGGNLGGTPAYDHTELEAEANACQNLSATVRAWGDSDVNWGNYSDSGAASSTFVVGILISLGAGMMNLF